jgi:hypothetical protein
VEEKVKNILDGARKTADELLKRGGDAVVEFIQNRSTLSDVTKVHGFYKLVTPSGDFLEYRHHCPVSGDGAIYPPEKGSVAIHCVDRRRDVFDPDAAMPTVVRYPAPRRGMLRLPSGESVIFTD